MFIWLGGFIVSNEKEPHGVVCFEKARKGKVGRKIKHTKSAKETFKNSNFVLCFKNIESIDVIIENLETTKKLMVEKLTEEK